MKKNNSKSENPLNINQSTYELIPKIKELSKTMSQKEVQEKLKINKKTENIIKESANPLILPIKNSLTTNLI